MPRRTLSQVSRVAMAIAFCNTVTARPVSSLAASKGTSTLGPRATSALPEQIATSTMISGLSATPTTLPLEPTLTRDDDLSGQSLEATLSSALSTPASTQLPESAPVPSGSPKKLKRRMDPNPLFPSEEDLGLYARVRTAETTHEGWGNMVDHMSLETRLRGETQIEAQDRIRREIRRVRMEFEGRPDRRSKMPPGFVRPPLPPHYATLYDEGYTYHGIIHRPSQKAQPPQEEAHPPPARDPQPGPSRHHQPPPTDQPQSASARPIPGPRYDSARIANAGRIRQRVRAEQAKGLTLEDAMTAVAYYMEGRDTSWSRDQYARAVWEAMCMVTPE